MVNILIIDPTLYNVYIHTLSAPRTEPILQLHISTLRLFDIFILELVAKAGIVTSPDISLRLRVITRILKSVN